MKKLHFTLLVSCLWMFPAAGQAQEVLTYDPDAAMYSPIITPELGTVVTVQDTIGATLAHHRAIRVLQENREAVGHELDRARAGWGPRVDITAGYGGGSLNNSTTRGLRTDTGWYTSSYAGATLVQPLWDGWATRSMVRSTEATYNSLVHRIFDNATTLALDGVIAHIDVLRRRYIYDLAMDNVARHEQILLQTKDRASLGADTMADVAQAESRLSRAMSTLVEARAALRDGEDTYHRLTGMYPPANMAPVTMPDYMLDSSAAVFEDALLHNPKIAAYIEDVNATKGDEQLTRSAFHPQITLEGGPYYSDRGGKRNYDQWTTSVDVMGVLRWNIFNSGADCAANRAANARVRQARQYLRNFADDLALEVETTWTAYLSAQEQFAHYTDAISYNITTRDAYQEQFILGQRSLLDVLDSESELFNSSTQAATSQSNILVGAYRLIALTGSMLPRMGIDTTGLDRVPYDDPKDPRERYDDNGNPWGWPWADREYPRVLLIND